MNARLNKGNVQRTAKWVLGLAGLASLAMLCSLPTRGQSAPAQTVSTPTPPRSAARLISPGTGAAASTSAAKQGTAPNLSAERPLPKGQREGITVHGHWTIEVKNPDGKVVTHREFENGLNSGTGAGLLASLLGRTAAAGGWIVKLSDTASLSNLILVAEPNSVAAFYCTNLANSVASGTCSTTLSINAPTVNGTQFAGATLTLAGSGTVPNGFPSNIGYVATGNTICAATDSPAVCFNDFTNNSYSNFALTSRNLDGNTTAGAAAGDPYPVAVTPGQTVNVQVVISFASGS